MSTLMAFLRMVLILLVLTALALVGLYIYGATLKREPTERTTPVTLDLGS